MCNESWTNIKLALRNNREFCEAVIFKNQNKIWTRKSDLSFRIILTLVLSSWMIAGHFNTPALLIGAQTDIFNFVNSLCSCLLSGQ